MKLQEAVSRHVSLKKNILQGNHASFIDKEFRKAIYTRSRLRNKFLKSSTKENKSLFKKQRNKFVLLKKKYIKTYLSKATENGVNTNKEFWKIIKPFLTNKGFLSRNEITLIENDEDITEEKILAGKFNNHYTNIAERSCGVRPKKLNLVNNSLNENESVIDAITCHFRNHPSVTEIKSKFMFAQSNAESSPSYTDLAHVAFLLKSLDIKKASGLDKIPPKLVKAASDILSVQLSQAINNSLMNGIFPDVAKVAMVSPIDKKVMIKTKFLIKGL